MLLGARVTINLLLRCEFDKHMLNYTQHKTAHHSSSHALALWTAEWKWAERKNWPCNSNKHNWMKTHAVPIRITMHIDWKGWKSWLAHWTRLKCPNNPILWMLPRMSIGNKCIRKRSTIQAYWSQTGAIKSYAMNILINATKRYKTHKNQEST